VRVGESVAGYLKAVNFIEVRPWNFAFTGWVLVASGIVVAWRYRRDIPILMMTIVPTVLCIAGYAFFLSGLDNYYYFSVMPAAVLMVVVAITAVPPARASRVLAVGLVIPAMGCRP